MGNMMECIKVTLNNNKGALVAHWAERVPYRLSPERSDPGLSPSRVHLLHALPSISHTFLSISLSNIKALKSENKSLKK